MSGPLGQVEIGSLSLTGLSSFRTLLQTLSADDVAPLALLQLENLGALFHINGKQASRLPELLQRSSSKRISDLNMLVGWRKGDSASLMAQSAGGQAIAMLCMCLENLLGNASVGEVLYELSKNVIPRSAAVCGSTQLARASKILSAKVFTIGFGNTLAQQASRILTIYEIFQKPAPEDLFAPITTETMIDFLHIITQLYRLENRVLRMKGCQSMLQFVTIVLTMFPDDTTLVVENTIVQKGLQERIILDVDSAHPIAITLLETRMDEKHLMESLIAPASEKFQSNGPSFLYKWKHHVAHALRIDFAAFGLLCTHELFEACSDLLLLIIPFLNCSADFATSLLPPNGIQALLGSEPIRRIHMFCATVLDAIPSGEFDDPIDAFRHLESVFKDLAGGRMTCTCVSNKCNITTGWHSTWESVKDEVDCKCRLRILWNSLGHAIAHSLSAILIEPSENAVVRYDRNNVPGFGRIALSELSKRLGVDYNRKLNARESPHTTTLSIVEPLYSNFTGDVGQYRLARSNHFSTVVSSPLCRLQYNPQKGYAYNLFDGQLICDGRYFSTLISSKTSDRDKAKESQQHNADGRIIPCSDGTHSNLSLTLRDMDECLILHTSIVVQGHLVKLDLPSVLQGAMGLICADPCEHPTTSELSSIWHEKVVITSIEAPRAERPKISIVQTAGDPVAQLLACEFDFSSSLALLQRDCCLNCAVAQAENKGIFQIIVA